ncbi:MAG TPA: glycine cleavage system aminomethyltransferase GcvT [Myxococcota bacterium]|nr:glycine cleavage system aminomethyltransferase GcvT [Myxococcota bacterium]
MSLRRTPLHETHVRLGARLVPFGGFEMPVQYTSILDEHRAVRERVGLFDVSHMGQIHLRGPEAVATAERLVTCEVASLAVGRVRYGCLCNEAGGVVDDVTVYRLADDALFLCVNASNIAKDREWILAHAPPGAGVEDRSDETGLLALQGPSAAPLLGGLADAAVGDLPRFAFLETKLAGRPALVSRTGYTGSDGFELYVASYDAAPLFDALLDAGGRFEILPAGLGARDTLRLEAALPLYGHELDDATSPLEARLDRFVKAAGFIGAEATARRRREGFAKLLVGFELVGRGVARAGHGIAARGVRVGTVTSGAPSPTLGKSIGLGYVPPRLAEPGADLAIRVREREIPARVVQTPFVPAGGPRRTRSPRT